MRVSWPGVVALVIVLLFVGFGYADKTRLHWVAAGSSSGNGGTDTVVGIEWRCTRFEQQDAGLLTNEFRGSELCEEKDGGPLDQYEYPGSSKVKLLNRRKELTVRTHAGRTYTVNVSPATTVALNSTWPAK